MSNGPSNTEHRGIKTSSWTWAFKFWKIIGSSVERAGPVTRVLLAPRTDHPGCTPAVPRESMVHFLEACPSFARAQPQRTSITSEHVGLGPQPAGWTGPAHGLAKAFGVQVWCPQPLFLLSAAATVPHISCSLGRYWWLLWPHCLLEVWALGNRDTLISASSSFPARTGIEEEAGPCGEPEGSLHDQCPYLSWRHREKGHWKLALRSPLLLSTAPGPSLLSGVVSVHCSICDLRYRWRSQKCLWRLLWKPDPYLWYRFSEKLCSEFPINGEHSSGMGTIWK